MAKLRTPSRTTASWEALHAPGVFAELPEGDGASAAAAFAAPLRAFAALLGAEGPAKEAEETPSPGSPSPGSPPPKRQRDAAAPKLSLHEPHIGLWLRQLGALKGGLPRGTQGDGSWHAMCSRRPAQTQHSVSDTQHAMCITLRPPLCLSATPESWSVAKHDHTQIATLRHPRKRSACRTLLTMLSMVLSGANSSTRPPEVWHRARRRARMSEPCQARRQ